MKNTDQWPNREVQYRPHRKSEKIPGIASIASQYKIQLHYNDKILTKSNIYQHPSIQMIKLLLKKTQHD